MTSAHPSNRRPGFTLVELLAVIAIIGIMIAVMVPSFSGMGRAAKLTTSVSQLKTTFSLARQHAITKREITYVVFATDNASLYQGTNIAHISKAFRGYNVYGQRSKYLRDWIQLPEGVMFVPSESVYQNSEPRDSKNLFVVDSTKNAVVSLPFPFNNSPSNSLVGVAFKPDGQMVLGNGSGRFEVFISEGWSDSTTTPITVTFKPLTQRQLFSVELFGITGQFRINDYSEI